MGFTSANNGAMQQLLQQYGPAGLGGMGGMGGMVRRPPGFGGQGQGALSTLPQPHQQAANAPPPIPGAGGFSQLGPYAQQALSLAGVQPGQQPQQPPWAGMQPQRPPWAGMQPQRPPWYGQGMQPQQPPGGVPFGGLPPGGIPGMLGSVPGLLERARG